MKRKTKITALFAVVMMLMTCIFPAGGFNREASACDGATKLSMGITAKWMWEKVNTWTIDKSVSPSVWNLFEGDTATSRYTVSVKKDWYHNKTAVGTVAVKNEGGFVTEGLALVVRLVDSVTGETCASTAVDLSAKPILQPGETWEYSFAIPYHFVWGRSYKVVVDASFTNNSEPSFPQQEANISPLADPTSEVNPVIHVTDTNGQAWTFSDNGSASYDIPFTAGAAGSKVTHDNTAKIEETGQTASASVAVNTYGLTVSKTANTSLERKYNWSITKTGDQTNLTLAKGQIYPVNYTVAVDKTWNDSKWKVAGQIAISNPAPVTAQINSLSDVVSPAIAASVSGAVIPYALEAGKTLVLDYSAELPDAAGRLNTATAVLQNFEYDPLNNRTPIGTTSYSGTASVSFADAAVSEIDESINVNDDLAGTLGTVSAAAAPAVFTYQRNVGPYNACGDYSVKNTASFVTNDTGTTGSDDHIVLIHVPCQGATLTIGYWKNHAGSGPQKDMVSPLLPLMPSTVGKATVTDSTIALQILTMSYDNGSPSNGMSKLYAQLLAARLNIANGADDCAIAATVAKADDFLKAHDCNDWWSMSKDTRNLVLGWMTTLDAYNNGLIGPGHASE